MLMLMVLGAVLSAGNEQFDRTAAEGAAQIAFARLREELAQNGPPTGEMREAMLDDPAGFRVREEAKESCRELFAAAARRVYSERCAVIRKELSLPESFAEDFSADESARIESLFPAAFERERREAVEAQARRIVASTRPDEAEFEAKSEDDLRATMITKILAGQQTPVFDENIAYISRQIVEPVIASGKAERKRQKEYLMRARAESAAPSRLTRELEEKLAKNVSDRAKKADVAQAWGVFPSVISQELPKAVSRRTLGRLIAEIDAVRLEITPAAVLAAISRDPSSHRRRSESERIFASEYSKTILETALAKAIEQASPSEREEIGAFLKENLGSESVVKAKDQTLNRELSTKWRKAREEASVLQASAVWPLLEDGSWYPCAELADSVVARSDYAAAVRNWQKLSGMEALSAVDRAGDVMDETLERAGGHVAKAFELARAAIAAQNEILDRVHLALAVEFKSNGEKPSVKTIAARLSAATIEQWSQERERTLWPDGAKPANADEQHAKLFPSVLRKIELLAKSILEELAKPPVEQPDPKEPPPEEPEPELPPEEPPEEVAEFTIDVSRKGDKVELRLMQGERMLYERKTDSSFRAFMSAMQELADRLGSGFLHLQ